MRYFYCLLVLISFNSAASVDTFINFLSGPVQGPEALLTCVNGIESDWRRDSEAHGTQKFTCPTNWYEKDFHFDLAYYHCQTRYGKSAQTCTELDKNKISARASDEKLIEQMSTFSHARFAEYKSQLIDQCCGDKSQCRKRFSETRLELTSELSSSASYHSDSSPSGRNLITITKGKLASTMNQESLERVLLVELAHACQFALISESTSDYRKFTTDRCSVESGRLMFKEGLGEEMASCVDQELQAQISAIPEAEKGKYCFGKWYREAFSDMKFRSEFKSIYHWTYDFLRRSQHQNYGSVYKYINCGLTPEIKSQVCKP
jgi:hypothetical protein